MKPVFAQILCSEYNSDIARRQPWYTVSVLCEDLKAQEIPVEIINDEAQIKDTPECRLIIMFSLKYLLKSKISVKYCTKYFLMSMPLYGLKSLASIRLKTIIFHAREFHRIFLACFFPVNTILKKRYADFRFICLSDQMYRRIIQCGLRGYRYVPISRIINEHQHSKFWKDSSAIDEKNSSESNVLTYGYLGPAYYSRCFDLAADFVSHHAPAASVGKFLVRSEFAAASRLLAKHGIESAPKIKLMVGFLTREEFLREFNSIDIVLLPFEMVMSECPVVVLESLVAGKTVYTSEASGFSEREKRLEAFVVLSNYKKPATWPSPNSHVSGDAGILDYVQKLGEDNERFLNELIA